MYATSPHANIVEKKFQLFEKKPIYLYIHSNIALL